MPVLIFLAIFAIVLVALALGNMFRGHDRASLRRPLPTPPEPPRPPQPSSPPRSTTVTQEESSTSESSGSISPSPDRIPTPTPDPSPTPKPIQPLPSPFIDNSTPSGPRQPLPSPFAENLPASGQKFPLPTPTPAEIPTPEPEADTPAEPYQFRPVPEIPTPEPNTPAEPYQFRPVPEIPTPEADTPAEPYQFRPVPTPEPEADTPTQSSPSIPEPAADTPTQSSPSTPEPEPEPPAEPYQFRPVPTPEPESPPQPSPPTPETDRVAATPSFPQSDLGDLASDMEVDYRKLRDLLAAQNYKEADGETRHLMVGIIRIMERDHNSAQSFEQFPCTDLRTIDRLWVQYSEGHFGFSVQKPIYDEVGQSYEALGDRVGWRQDGEWLNYHELTFNDRAPRGHLPRVSWVKVFGYCGWEPSVLAQRLANCDF